MVVFIIINGAQGRNRTGTVFLPRDFKYSLNYLCFNLLVFFMPPYQITS